MLQTYLLIDIDLFSIAVLLLLIWGVKLRESGKSYAASLFLLLCYSTVIVILLEMITWMLDGTHGLYTKHVLYSANFVFILLNPVPVAIWLCYLDYQYFASIEHLKKRWFYIQPFLIVCICMLINLFTPFVFSITEQNTYQREPGLILVSMANFSYFIISIVMVLRNKDTVKKRVRRVLEFFAIIPVSGAILQLSIYGTVFIWPSMTLAIAITFVFLEIQRDIRDYLTGLLNRQQIEEKIVMRMHEFQQKGGFCILMLDIDGFKDINDTYGHNEGDRALITMANIIMRSVKRRDCVSRYGGDEFLLLLETDSPDVVQKIINRLYWEAEKEVKNILVPYKMRFSVGYAIYEPIDYGDLKTFIHAADSNMYGHKKSKQPNLSNT